MKPTSAHNALTTIVENGKELEIVRDNMPFGEVGKGEFGTYFIGYARSPRRIEQMLENMFVGKPPGNYDRLLDFSRAVTGTLFFVPSATFLENVTTGEAAASAADPSPDEHKIDDASQPQMPPPDGSLGIGSLKERLDMNNLHRELAPISDAAWAQIEEEASRTLKRHLAARRVVDVQGPKGVDFSAVGTGHLSDRSRRRATESKPRNARQRRLSNCASRSNSRARRSTTVERGAIDSDWSPLKEAARKIAFAEDRAVFDGYAAAGIQGVRQGTSNPVLTLPSSVSGYPGAVAQAVSQLRLAGVNGPYALLLGAEPYTAIGGASDDGYPVLQHIQRLVDGEIIWAPAIEGGVRALPPAAAILS